MTASTLVWQNAITTFNEDITLEEMSQDIDLYYCHWNGTTIENNTAVTNNNQNLEMTYAVATDGTNISVVWQENSNNDSLVMSGTNSIYRKQCINGNWQSVEHIASNLSMINSIDTGYINNANVVAYSAKSTSDDELEIFYYNGTQIAQLTDDTIHDYSVNILNNEIYWIAENSINYIINGDISTKEIIHTLDGAVTKMRVLGNSSGDKSIVWTLADETRVDFYSIDYNLETNSYGTVSPIDTVKGIVRGWDACLTTTGDIELSYCNSEPLDEQTTKSRARTLNLIQKAEEDFCDISVISEITYEGNILPNQELSLTANIYNRGSLPTNQFIINVIDDAGNIIQTTNIEQNVGINETAELQFSFTLPETITRTNYTIQILPQQYDDINESDNTATLSIGFADLSIQSIEEVRIDLGTLLLFLEM